MIVDQKKKKKNDNNLRQRDYNRLPRLKGTLPTLQLRNNNEAECKYLTFIPIALYS